MSLGEGDKRRVVVPRWRSLLTTPSVETLPVARFPDVLPQTALQYRDMVGEWRKSGKPEDVVDIFDAGIATGSRSLAVEAARQIIKNSHEFHATIVERAHHVMFGPRGHVNRITTDVDNHEVIARRIAKLKKDLREFPRNSLAHVELARLYCRLAQNESAEKHIFIALSLSPNDRFTLRAATRFFTLLNEPRLALNALWAAEALQIDPWIQSAEMAAASLQRAPTRRAERAASALERRKTIPIEYSELAAGWATRLDQRGTSNKKIFRFLGSTLAHPTENALAQGLWLTEHIGKEFGVTFPKVHIPHDAFEAQTLALCEMGDFGQASVQATNWIADQPFQSRSFMILCFLRFVHLFDYKGAQKAAIDGLVLHEDDWGLLNYATITSAMLGSIDTANAYYAKLDKVAASDQARAFKQTAKGMIEFAKGNFREGIDCYIDTIRYARRKGLQSLYPNILIYLVDNLSRHSQLDEDTFKALKKLIDDRIKKANPAEARELNQVLASRSAYWNNNFTEQSLLDRIRIEALREELSSEERQSEPLVLS